MGAYANPQEIEGQFDLTQNQRSLQRMFDTVTVSAMNVSERIAKEQQINAERVQSILNETQEKKAKLQVLVESAAGKAKTGLNYDCYKEGIEEWNKLGNKSAFGAASPEDKRKRAQILASVDNFSSMAANTNDMVEQYDKALALIGDGGYDVKGSNPTMIRLLEALKAKDGDVAQFSFRKDENGNTDYANEGFKVFAYKDKNGIEYPETFVSGQELEKALNGNAPNGMVYKKSYAGDNKKIYDTFKIGENGMGIFEYDNDEPTGRVSENYLTDQPGALINLKPAQGGRWVQKTVKIDREKIALMVDSQVKAIAEASAIVPNEVATKYNNYVLPFMDEKTNTNFNKYKELESFAKFEFIPGYDKAFPYNEGILTSDEEKFKVIRHNNKAAFMQTVKTEQAVGEPYFIADPKPVKTKKSSTGSKNTKATFNDAKAWVYRQKKGVVDDISFNGKSVTYDGKNFMIARGPNEFEVLETYDAVLNYLRPLKTPLK
jgi:hypothetical protein